MEEATQSVKYPDITVQLAGQDGNAFFIIGRVTRALRKHGCKQEEIDQFISQATSGDYDNLLQTCMRWVDVC